MLTHHHRTIAASRLADAAPHDAQQWHYHRPRHHSACGFRLMLGLALLSTVVAGIALYTLIKVLPA